MTAQTQVSAMGALREYWKDSSRSSRAKGYALIALVSLATLLLAREGPLEIIVGGAATSAIFLYGFMQFNPRYVGVELIALTLLGYLTLPKAPVYWMMGSALGGGMAAILALRDAEEDDHFFVPPFVAAVFTLTLFVLGQQGGLTESFSLIGRYIATYREAFDAMLALPDYAEINRSFTSRPDWGVVHERVGLVAVSVLLGLWFIVVWLMNRFARRRTGRAQGVFNSLLLFRIRPGYVFLLIGGLVFEILATWRGRESFRIISYPLFSVCIAAFLMVYVGSVFFMAALWRAQSAPEPAPMVSFLLLLALVFMPWIGPVFGLADVWMDFRKTKMIRERFL